MARKPDKQYREAKRNFIIENARKVFCRKGYTGTTMQDIIEECGISRGGIYLYFSSVKEIFMAVIASRNRGRFEHVRELIDRDTDFWQLLDIYLGIQKERLLSMENSILRATYDFYHAHQGAEDVEFRNTQIHAVRQSITGILELGAKQGAITGANIPAIAESFMFTIEGLGVFGMFQNLTEQQVDTEFMLMKHRLRNMGGVAAKEEVP